MVKRKRSREAVPATEAVTRVTAPVPAKPRVPVPIGQVEIATDDEARALAHRLLMPGRSWPVVVVTVASGQTDPYPDVPALVEDLRGLAEVVVMPTSGVSRAFADEMPEMTQVYGGASRVYAVDQAWVVDPHRSPLRFAYSFGDRDRVTSRLVADAMSAVMAAGLLSTRASGTTRQVVAGTIEGLVGSRAFVRLDDGRMGTLWEELTGFGVQLPRLVRKGQRVRGRVDPGTQRLDLELPEDVAPPVALPGTYVAGSVVLAEVVTIAADALTLRVAPGFDVVTPLAEVTANDLDRLETLFNAGDVVVARLTATEPRPALSLLDVEDDDLPVDAPSILPGGPPWLTVPATPEFAAEPSRSEVPDSATLARDLGTRLLPTAPSVAPEDDPTAPTRAPTPLDLLPGRRGGAPPPRVIKPEVRTSPATGPAVRDLGLALAAERAKNSELQRALDEAQGALHELAEWRRRGEDLERLLRAEEERVETWRTKYRDADLKRQRLEKKLRNAGSVAAPDEDARAWFADPADALRLDVTVAWARRVPAGEKARSPLGDWSIGAEFADSLANLGSVSWRKLCEVVADVLVGDPARLASLDQHELRINEGGGSPAVTRADGAVCYRVALQVNSPSARRMHYWRRGDHVELSRVVLHDDVMP